MKEVIPVVGSDFYISADDENYKKVFEKFNQTYNIKPVYGTRIVMAKLKEGESVCAGDLRHYHFLLTKK